jgi:hypothetical protein
LITRSGKFIQDRVDPCFRVNIDPEQDKQEHDADDNCNRQDVGETFFSEACIRHDDSPSMFGLFVSSEQLSQILYSFFAMKADRFHADEFGIDQGQFIQVVGQFIQLLFDRFANGILQSFHLRFFLHVWFFSEARFSLSFGEISKRFREHALITVLITSANKSVRGFVIVNTINTPPLTGLHEFGFFAHVDFTSDFRVGSIVFSCPSDFRIDRVFQRSLFLP